MSIETSSSTRKPRRGFSSDSSPLASGCRFGIAATFVLVSTIAAQDRPMRLTEPATTIARGAWRVELGTSYYDSLYLPVGRTTVGIWDLLEAGVTYGVADNVEVEMRMPVIVRDVTRDHQDAGDITLAAKFRLPRLLGASATAFRASVRLPQTEDIYGIGTDEMAFSGDTALTWSRRRYQIHVNVGMAIEGDPEAARAQNDVFRYGIAFHYNGRITPLLEIAGTSGPDGPGTRDVHTLLVGAKHRRAGVTLDFALSAGLNRDTYRYGITAGIAWTTGGR